MRLAAAASLVLGLATAPASAEVAIRVSGGRVDLTATAAPLADVLDRLARQTGMKLVYEGPAPRQLVTLSLHGRTPAETVLAVFEGLGLNYALVADASGGVQALVVAGASSATAASPSAPAGRPAFGAGRRPFGPPPGSSPESVEPAFDQGEEEGEADDVDFAGGPEGVEGAEGAEAEQMPGGAPPNMNPQSPGAQPETGTQAAPPGQAAPAPPAPPPATTPFSASPFTPQPQPFPPIPPGVPPAGASPTPQGPENKPQAPPPQQAAPPQ